jgi:hypothetical protein
MVPLIANSSVNFTRAPHVSKYIDTHGNPITVNQVFFIIAPPPRQCDVIFPCCDLTENEADFSNQNGSFTMFLIHFKIGISCISTCVLLSLQLLGLLITYFLLVVQLSTPSDGDTGSSTSVNVTGSAVS